ncbi:GLPGLI family protein [Candidatus Palauibacter sp.]|uniref:GLPGLI family protein n=1 Tax=Candidatus Palauibacter sp. TaxID=3101350 RepID=UPI003CC532F3
MKTPRRLRLLILPALSIASIGLVPATAVAQEGRVHYLRSVQFDFHVPERWAQMRDRMPPQSTTAMVLLFDGSSSLMKRSAEEEEAGPGRAGARATGGGDRRALGMMMRLRQQSASRSDQENLREAYVDFASGAVAETREFMGRTFLIRGERPTYQWRLGSEQREFLGFMVQKATAVHDGSEIEAWFTPQIPVQAGPGEFGGLPGLILVLSRDSGHTLYSAIEVDLTGLGDDSIAPPEAGDMVSREEYEEIVAERIEELRTLRAAGNRRRPFDGQFR